MNHPHDQACFNCINFLPKPAEPVKGYCRAHPPERVDQGLASSPTVPVGWWCGEWAKAAPQPAPLDQPVPEMPLGVDTIATSADQIGDKIPHAHGEPSLSPGYFPEPTNTPAIAGLTTASNEPDQTKNEASQKTTGNTPTRRR